MGTIQNNLCKYFKYLFILLLHKTWKIHCFFFNNLLTISKSQEIAMIVYNLSRGLSFRWIFVLN